MKKAFLLLAVAGMISAVSAPAFAAISKSNISCTCTPGDDKDKKCKDGKKCDGKCCKGKSDSKSTDSKADKPK
jgi:hypothetical protein